MIANGFMPSACPAVSAASGWHGRELALRLAPRLIESINFVLKMEVSAPTPPPDDIHLAKKQRAAVLSRPIEPCARNEDSEGASAVQWQRAAGDPAALVAAGNMGSG